MKFRWTMKELKEKSDQEILIGLINERTSDLNPYAPLHKRLSQIRKNLEVKSKENSYQEVAKVAEFIGKELTDVGIDTLDGFLHKYGYEIRKRVV